MTLHILDYGWDRMRINRKGLRTYLTSISKQMACYMMLVMVISFAILVYIMFVISVRKGSYWLIFLRTDIVVIILQNV